MEKKLFEKYERDQITDDILREASQLFSKNYGIWGKEAARVVGPFAKEVGRKYRERGLAVDLLNQLRRDDDCIYGIASSHAAACLAAARAFGSGIEAIQLGFICEHAAAILKASPIGYIKDAKVRGELFNPEVTHGTVSSVDTNYICDHTEPLEALENVREVMDWPLGELIEGYEFLVILEARRLVRPKSPLPAA
ncbi:hypothetical protein MMC16_006579 [Acarospora aff. strigata]|nr:hypothetical protein [Acarospora aff. strigata]